MSGLTLQYSSWEQGRRVTEPAAGGEQEGPRAVL